MRWSTHYVQLIMPSTGNHCTWSYLGFSLLIIQSLRVGFQLTSGTSQCWKQSIRLFKHLFSEGSFVVSKTKRKFSAVACDHVHEQCNALVKGDGGVNGITGNYNALQSWMIARPVIDRLLRHFEGSFSEKHWLHEYHQSLPSFWKHQGLKWNAWFRLMKNFETPSWKIVDF